MSKGFEQRPTRPRLEDGYGFERINERLGRSPQPPELELNICHAPWRPERRQTRQAIDQAKVRRSETQGYGSATGPTSECLTSASFEIVSLKRVNKDWVPSSSKNLGFSLPFAKLSPRTAIFRATGKSIAITENEPASRAWQPPKRRHAATPARRHLLTAGRVSRLRL